MFPKVCFYSTFFFVVTTTKKSNIVLTENIMNIRDNTRKHNSLSLGEFSRETFIERHQVLDKNKNGQHISNIPNLANENEGKFTKHHTSALKSAVVAENQALFLQEANEFDKKISGHYEFHNENSVVKKKLDKYLKGDLNNIDAIHKFKHKVKASTVNDNYSLNNDGRINDMRNKKNTVKLPKNLLNNSKDWNSLEDDDYQQPTDENSKNFKYDKSVRNKHRSYLYESTTKTEHFGTTFVRTKLEWKFLDKATTLYEVIKKWKLKPKRERNIILDSRLDNESSYSDISVKDVMEAARRIRYNTSSFINSRMSEPSSLLRNIVPSFKNAHVNKIFNADENNEGSAIKYTTITPFSFAETPMKELHRQNSFDSKQISSNVFTNLSPESILSYNVNRPKVKLPVGNEVGVKTNSEEYHYKNKTLHREKTKIKSIAKDIKDFNRETSNIAKYKKRLHSKLGDFKKLVKKITISSTNSAENFIKNSLDPSSKQATWLDEENNKYNRKSRLNGNIALNRYPVDTRLRGRPVTKKRVTQDIAVSRYIMPIQKTDNDNLPALTPKFMDNRKVPSVKKHLREENTNVTNIKDVLFKYLENLTNMKRVLKVTVLQDNIKMPTIKEMKQNKFDVDTLLKSQESPIDEILATKPNIRRSELGTIYKDSLTESLPKDRHLKSASFSKTSKPVPEYDMAFDSTESSNIMQLKKTTKNLDTSATTTTTLKVTENPTFAERILSKILNLNTSTYDMTMAKEKLLEAEMLLRNSLIKYLNVSKPVKKDLEGSSFTTYPRPVLLESLKYPSVFDVYKNIGRWQPKLELGSGIPTIVTNVSNDLTNEKLPPMRHWNSVVPSNKPASYIENILKVYLDEIMRSTYTEVPIQTKNRKQNDIQVEEDKKNQFRYKDRSDGTFSRNIQILPYVRRMHNAQDTYPVNTTALAIRQEILRKKARKKFLEQIEGVRNKDLIRILFTSPYINQHLLVNPSLKKQPPDVFNKDMYSVLPLDVANYQKYKKEDRQPPTTYVFMSNSSNYNNRPRWILPINYENKLSEELQSTSVAPLYNLENDFLDDPKSSKTNLFPQMDNEDIVSDLADDLENTENKLQSGETSAHDKLDTKIDNSITPIYEIGKELAPVNPLTPDQFEEIEDLRNEEEEILRNIIKTSKKNITTTDKLTLAQLNNESILTTASLTEDSEDKEVPIIDEGLRPIEKPTNKTENTNIESDNFTHYIKEVQKAKTYLKNLKPKYPTVKSRKFTTFRTPGIWEEEVDDSNMKTSYSKPIKGTNIKYTDSIPTYETVPIIKNSNNVFLPTYLTAPFHGRGQYYIPKPQIPTTSAPWPIVTYATSSVKYPDSIPTYETAPIGDSNEVISYNRLQEPTTTTFWPIMTYATLPIRDYEVDPSQLNQSDLEDQEMLTIDTDLRPVQKFRDSIIFEPTTKITTEPIFNELLRPVINPTNGTGKISTESDDLTHYSKAVEIDDESTETLLTALKPKYSSATPTKLTSFKTHTHTWKEETDEKNKNISHFKPIKVTGDKYPYSVPSYKIAQITEDSNNVFRPTYLKSPFQGKGQYYISKGRIHTTSTSWPFVTYATLPVGDDEVGPSLSKDLEDQKISIDDKDLRPLQTFWTPIIYATPASTTTEAIFEELLRPMEEPINNTEKPSAESDDSSHYLDDEERNYESVKTHLITFTPKYLPVTPRKFTTFTNTSWEEEEIDEKNMKISYSEPINGTGVKYPISVPTYEPVPSEHSKNDFLPTYLTYPFQNDQYYISKPLKPTITSWPTVASPVRDDEIGPLLSKDLENQDTPIIDKDLRPLQTFWKPIIFATTARASTVPIFNYPNQDLQGNDEKDLERMTGKPSYEMETERTLKTTENQKYALYESYWNNLIDNNVIGSTNATLFSQDNGEVSQITQKQNSFKFKDWRERFRHTTTYFPNIRVTVTPLGKKKGEGLFYDTLHNRENELTTAKSKVFLNRPSLAVKVKNEAINTTLVDQDIEYKTGIPTFLHRTVSRQNLTRIIPIFKEIDVTTDSISHAYDNLSRNPILTTHETIFKPYMFSIPDKNERIYNVTVSKENDENILEKPILDNQVTLKPFLSEDEEGTSVTLLKQIKEESNKRIMTTSFPKRTSTFREISYVNITKSRKVSTSRRWFPKDESNKYDKFMYPIYITTTTRPRRTPTLTRHKLKPTLTAHISRTTVRHDILKTTVRHLSRSTLTRHIYRTATRTDGRYNQKSDGTDYISTIDNKNNVIGINKNLGNLVTESTTLATMIVKDVEAQSPMIDIGLRPIENKFKPLYFYGMDKFKKKEQKDSEKMKDYDEKFLNDTSRDSPGCKGDTCKSKQKYTTMIRPPKTYPSEYRNTSMDVLLPINETAGQAGSELEISADDKVSTYTKINHDENKLQNTTPFEFVTLSADNEHTFNKLDDTHKIKPPKFEMPSDDQFTIIDEPPTNSDSSPDVKFASNLGEVFPNKAPTDTGLFFDMFPYENAQRPTETLSSSDKKFANTYAVPRNETVIPLIETTIPPLKYKMYSPTTKFKYDKSKIKFNQDFWKPKFFPKKMFTSTKPTQYSGRTPLIRKKSKYKEKLKGYPTNIVAKETMLPTAKQHHGQLPSFVHPTLSDAIKHWTDYVQDIDEKKLTPMTTKYIQKPTRKPPIGFATIKHQSKSPMQSIGKTKSIISAFIPHPSETLSQSTDEQKKKVSPTSKYQYTLLWKPEKYQLFKHNYTQPVSTYPSTSPQTTKYRWPKPAKATDRDVQEKQIEHPPVKYLYASNAVTGNYSTQKPFTTSTFQEETSEKGKPNRLTTENYYVTWATHSVLKEKELVVHKSPTEYSVEHGKGVTPTKTTYITLEETPTISKKAEWRPTLYNVQQKIPIPIHTYSFKPEFVNVTNNKESSHRFQGSPYTITGQDAYFVPKVMKPTSTDRPVPTFIPYTTYTLSTKSPNIYAPTIPESEDRIKIKNFTIPTYMDMQSRYHKKPFNIFIDITEAPYAPSFDKDYINTRNDYKYPDEGKYFDHNKLDKNMYPDKNKYPDKYQYPAKGKYLSKNKYYPNNNGEYFDKERYPEVGTYYDKERYPNYEDNDKGKYPDKDEDHNKDVKYPTENNFYQDQYPKQPLIPPDLYNKDTYHYEYPSEPIVSPRPLSGDKSKDRYPDEDKYLKKIAYQDNDRYQDKNKYTDKEKETSEFPEKDRYPVKDKYVDRDRYPHKDIDTGKDKYYQYPPTVNGHSAQHMSAPGVRNKEYNYPDVDKGKYLHEETYESYDKYRQEEKYYDQKYSQKLLNNNQTGGRYNAHHIFTPQRIPGYKDRYPDQHQNYLEHTTRYVPATKRTHGSKDSVKYPDKKTYPDDIGYSDDIKYHDKNEFYKDIYPQTPDRTTMKYYDQYYKNSSPYEPIVSPRPPSGGENKYRYYNKEDYPDRYKYPYKDVYNYKDRYPDENSYKDGTNEYLVSPRPLSGGKNKDRYPDKDVYPDEDKYLDRSYYKDRNPVKDRNFDKDRYHNEVKDYRDRMFAKPTYPYSFDVTAHPYVPTKPHAVKTTSAINYGYDIIPGGVTKVYTNDNRPKVPSLPDRDVPYGLEERPILKPPIVHGPGEKDATPTAGSDLPEMNFENRPTLPYQPELDKLVDLFNKTKWPTSQSTTLPLQPTTTAKVGVPNLSNDKGAEDHRPRLICGKDNSPVNVVYEGVAKIETYPWLGVLVYPRGR